MESNLKSLLATLGCILLLFLYCLHLKVKEKEAVSERTYPQQALEYELEEWQSCGGDGGNDGTLQEQEEATWTAPRIIYTYRLEVETVPENQHYRVRPSGYQQYEVEPIGEGYSYNVYEFQSYEVLTTEECYEFVKNHPEKVKRISSRRH